jgi:hypothetical protein
MLTLRNETIFLLIFFNFFDKKFAIHVGTKEVDGINKCFYYFAIIDLEQNDFLTFGFFFSS